MTDIKHLLEKNRQWAGKTEQQEPGFFDKLSKLQAPQYLWIGCSDSRVPADRIVDLLPGELFVHRNIGNLVIHTDLNCLSVIQYAVEVLKVKHIIVSGHYGCGGVMAALEDKQLGLIDHWISHIRDIHNQYEAEITSLATTEEKSNRLCELNVIEQVKNVCYTNIVQNAWKKGQSLSVHGWIYSIHDGILNDLDVSINNKSQLKRLRQLG